MQSFTRILPRSETLLLRYATTGSPTSYCRELVRKYDHENYLCTLLLRKESIHAAFAVRAFNVEIAQVRDQAREMLAAKMRFQFLRDTLSQIREGKIPRNPVGEELARAMTTHKLSYLFLRRLIDTRADHVSEGAFRTQEELETYSESSVSTLLYILMESNGVRSVQADHAASHVGRAIGIVTALRAVPFYAQRGKMLLPLDLCAKYNVVQQNVLHGQVEEGLRDLSLHLGTAANNHLATARTFLKDLPGPARLVLLPAIACDAYLQRLQTHNFDPFNSLVTSNHPWLPLSLLKHRWAKTF